MKRLATAALLSAAACAPQLPEPQGDERIVVQQEANEVVFAVIGDYGSAGPGEAAVAELVASWDPDLVITVGDNNYPSGARSTIDDNVGQYYHGFIAPYRGEYGAGADTNRFFPALGNHDWMAWKLAPYLEYFALPGNERYYDVRWGPVHFFAVDSDKNEPHGTDADSVQGRWLQQALANSDAPHKVVYMHHPPYSSGRHGSEERMQWPFFAWGADLVLAGHDHHYERIVRPEGTYVVNGLGGFKTYDIREPIEGSQVRFNQQHGAIRAVATARTLEFSFVTIDGQTVDTATSVDASGPEPEPQPEPRLDDFERYED